MERASVTPEEIVDLIKRIYGCDVTDHRKLASYDDINFHVNVKAGSSNPNIADVSPHGYVLKMLNSEDSKMVGFLDAMHAAIECVYRNGIVTSCPVKTTSGQFYTIEQLSTQSGNPPCKFVVRLFEFVPGEILQGKPYTPELCYQVGQLGGKIDRALKDFHHPALTNHKRYWSLTSVPELTDKLHAVDDPDKRLAVELAIRQFKENVVPAYDKLKSGTIHADLNHENIIVNPTQDSNNSQQNTPHVSGYTVNGIIDFGDLVHEYPIFELGIVVSYMMTFSRVINPIEAGGHVLAGYLREFDLPSYDLHLLKECAAGRLSQSLVNGEFAYKQSPDNLYCLESSKDAWPILQLLNKTSKCELYAIWGNILEQYEMKDPFTSV